MERRKFISKGIAAGAILPATYASLVGSSANASPSESINNMRLPEDEELVIERPVAGRPHEGKVLAAIQPHCDDIALFAGGTVAKLIDEGYTAYLIRVSMDDIAGRGNTLGERVVNNELSNEAAAKILGFKKCYDLGYRNHRLEEYNIQEIKGRLIFLFRALKVDTIVSYDPWSAYEHNPDHYVTARAVEAACGNAGAQDYPEQLEWVKPHGVRERYYYASSWSNQPAVNRIVDISKYVDKKVASIVAITAQGPGGNAGSRLRKSLDAQGKKLAILGDDDATADFNYVKNFVIGEMSGYLTPSNTQIGKKYKLQWAEEFHHIGGSDRPPSLEAEYIRKNTIPK
jgi:LmbE family N-acetylglucosaminyl deacetylase